MSGKSLTDGLRAFQDPSYLSTYGVTNPWTCWLLAQQSELVAEDAASFSVSNVAAPKCPKPRCRQRMSWRPGAYKCYRHDPPIVIAVEATLPVAPEFDALAAAAAGKALDYAWNPLERRWEVVELPS